MNHGQYSYSMPKPYTSLSMPSKFPEDIECIIKSNNPSCGSLYISNIEAAENLTTLKRFGIRAILTCAKGYELRHPPSEVPDYKYIPTVDHDECNISVHFQEAVEFIKKQLAKTNLLVHCIAGVSRSVTMVIAYLISERSMSYDEAYRTVKSRRKIICPNDGFIKQLKEFHSKQKTIKRANSSPKAASKTDDSFSISIKTPIKENNYFESTLLTQYKSTYLTPYAKSTHQDRFEQTKSSQLSKTKTGTERPLVSTFKADKEERPIFNRTLTGHFSNSKTAEQYKQDQFQRKYDYLDKHHQERRTPVSQRLIKIDLSPNKEDTRELTPQKGSYRTPVDENAVQSETKDRKGYFQNMNRDLSDKIDSIRQKYDIERKKLFEKYQLSDKKIIRKAEQSEIKPKKSDYDYPVKQKGSLSQQSSANRFSEEGVKEEGAQKRYQDVRQYFSKSRISYAEIYDQYTKKRIENQPRSIPADVYLKYDYGRQQKGKATLERYRPYSQYERYPNRSYKDYLNYQADYSYKGY